MKKKPLILVLVFIWNKSFCSQVPIGVDRSKVVIWEYWKFDAGEKSNEMLLFNPTNEDINIVFRKWRKRREGEPPITFTESDTLLKVKRLKPNEYLLYKSAMSEIRDIYGGLIEVRVSGEWAGLYDLEDKEKAPKSKIQTGIIINQRPNVGSLLKYEIIYEHLKFKKNNDPKARVVYLEKDFYYSGFVKAKPSASSRIELTDIRVENLKIGSKETFDLCLNSTDKKGNFEVTFKIVNHNQRGCISKCRCVAVFPFRGLRGQARERPTF